MMQQELSAYLSEYLKNNDFTSSFADTIQNAPCWKAFIGVFESDTLTVKLGKAIRFRDCGDFNKAMLYVSEINRDHVTCLRKIQHSFDALGSRPKAEVILRNFRQVIPLEVGIENAPEMLGVIEQKIAPWQEKNNARLQSYHDLLTQIEERQSEIDISYRFEADVAEVEDLKGKLNETRSDFGEVQKQLAGQVISLTASLCTPYLEEGESIQQLFMSLLVPVATICFSPIITKHASDVKVCR